MPTWFFSNSSTARRLHYRADTQTRSPPTRGAPCFNAVTLLNQNFYQTSSSGTPVLGFGAYSGTGKTTLLTRLLPVLRERGLRVGLVKHAHHRFEIDHDGKDSFKLRKAGATPVLVASKERWAIIHENENNAEPDLGELIDRVDDLGVDLILVEGFKHEAMPKVELTRPSLGRPLIFPEDHNVIAVACDDKLGESCALPILDLNNIDEIADFVIAYMRSSLDTR